jgi:hypothetical protein
MRYHELIKMKWTVTFFYYPDSVFGATHFLENLLNIVNYHFLVQKISAKNFLKSNKLFCEKKCFPEK